MGTLGLEKGTFRSLTGNSTLKADSYSEVNIKATKQRVTMLTKLPSYSASIRERGPHVELWGKLQFKIWW